MAEGQKDMPRAKRREASVPDTAGGSNPKLIDPTENVKALMAASLEAMADLRQADREFNRAKWKHLKEIGDLRSRHTILLRKSDLATAEKTRQVDVLAATNSAASLATAVQALQAASDRNAETLRNQVSESAASVQTQTDNLFRRTEASISAVNDRVGALERANAAGAGRQSVVDPQMTTLIEKMEKVAAGQANSGGRREGMGNAWGVMLSAVGLIATLLTIGAVVLTNRPSAPPAQTTAPQVIYVPAPQVTPTPQQIAPAR